MDFKAYGLDSADNGTDAGAITGNDDETSLGAGNRDTNRSTSKSALARIYGGS